MQQICFNFTFSAFSIPKPSSNETQSPASEYEREPVLAVFTASWQATDIPLDLTDIIKTVEAVHGKL